MTISFHKTILSPLANLLLLPLVRIGYEEVGSNFVLIVRSHVAAVPRRSGYQIKLGGIAKSSDARLVFAGGAVTLPVTLGMLRPTGEPRPKDGFIPTASTGALSVLS